MKVSIAELPEILTAQHISDYLFISRGKVYELFKISESAGGISNFDIGASKRVKKVEFVRWIEARTSEKSAITSH